MSYAKRSKEEWAAWEKEQALQRSIDNVQAAKDTATATGLEGNSGLIMLVIAELKNINYNLSWIQKELKKKQSTDVPF